jgi:hypothetical protein
MKLLRILLSLALFLEPAIFANEPARNAATSSVSDREFIAKTKGHIYRVVMLGLALNQSANLGLDPNLLENYLWQHDREKFVPENTQFLLESEGIDFDKLPPDKKASAKERVAKMNKLGEEFSVAFFNQFPVPNPDTYRLVERVADITDRYYAAGNEFGKKMWSPVVFLKAEPQTHMLATKGEALWATIFKHSGADYRNLLTLDSEFKPKSFCESAVALFLSR